MEKKTMGSFMAALRKANGYTQQQIADKLNVSNKTVSKWECDDGYPEISMLPAIAELYGVTVDELLRGVKTNQTLTEEKSNNKTEEQLKYLCDKSFSKFNNGSIIAIALGLCSLIIAFVLLVKTSINAYLFSDYPIYILLAFIALVLCAVSVVVILITFNNLVNKIHDNDVIEKQVFYKKLSKCIDLLSTNIALDVAACLTLAASIMVEWGTPWYIILGVPIAVLSIIIDLLVRLVLRKKYDIMNFGISPEKQKYRKKHTIVTAIILLVVIAFNILSPIAVAFINDEYATYSYSFDSSNTTASAIDVYIGCADAEYDPLEEAKRDYYKFKNHIIGEQELYQILEERFDEQIGEYELDIEKITYVFSETDDGYKFVGTEYSEIETLTFKSLEEKEKYELENVFPNSALLFEELKRNVTFDDETFTINYCGDLTSNSIYEIAIARISFLAIFGEILIIFIASAIIYKRKTKDL